MSIFSPVSDTHIDLFFFVWIAANFGFKGVESPAEKRKRGEYTHSIYIKDQKKKKKIPATPAGPEWKRDSDGKIL